MRLIQFSNIWNQERHPLKRIKHRAQLLKVPLFFSTNRMYMEPLQDPTSGHKGSNPLISLVGVTPTSYYPRYVKLWWRKRVSEGAACEKSGCRHGTPHPTPLSPHIKQRKMIFTRWRDILLWETEWPHRCLPNLWFHDPRKEWVECNKASLRELSLSFKKTKIGWCSLKAIKSLMFL
jgi:hypothetical protein